MEKESPAPVVASIPHLDCLLRCPFRKCGGTAASVDRVCGWSHSRVAVCNLNCKHKWHWCADCSPAPRVWTSKRTLNSHTKEHHSTDHEVFAHFNGGDDSSDCWSGTHSDESLMADEDVGRVERSLFECGGRLVYFPNAHSQKYFKHNKDNGGCAYLVANSQCCSDETGSHINECDVMLHMNLSHLASKLSRLENAELADVIDQVKDKTNMEVCEICVLCCFDADEPTCQPICLLAPHLLAHLREPSTHLGPSADGDAAATGVQEAGDWLEDKFANQLQFHEDTDCFGPKIHSEEHSPSQCGGASQQPCARLCG